MLPDTPRYRRLALLARAAYAVIICFATLSNLQLDADPREALVRAERALGMGWGVRTMIVDGARNVVLFAGFGAVWAVTSRQVRARWAVLGATLAGAGLSAFVECVQLYSRVRFASWLDFVTNAGGAAIGALGLLGMVELARHARVRKSFVGIPALGFAGSYLLVLFGEGVAPTFPRLLQPGNVPGLRDRFAFMVRYWLEVGPPASVPLTDAMLAVPAGLFATAAIAELGARYATAAVLSALACAMVPFLAQMVRAAGGQPIDSGVFLAHALGGVVGAAIAWRGLPAFVRRFRGPARPAVLLAVYAVLLFLWSARPFALRRDLAQVVEQFGLQHWTPLAMLGMRADAFSVTDVTGQFFLLLPVGALLSVWPLRRRGPLRSVMPAFWLAFVLEVSQAFIVDRWFDVTDVLVRVAGVAVGWVIVRHAGYAPYGEVLADASQPPPPPRRSTERSSRARARILMR